MYVLIYIFGLFIAFNLNESRCLFGCQTNVVCFFSFSFRLLKNSQFQHLLISCQLVRSFFFLFNSNEMLLPALQRPKTCTHTHTHTQTQRRTQNHLCCFESDDNNRLMSASVTYTHWHWQSARVSVFVGVCVCIHVVCGDYWQQIDKNKIQRHKIIIQKHRAKRQANPISPSAASRT